MTLLGQSLQIGLSLGNLIPRVAALCLGLLLLLPLGGCSLGFGAKSKKLIKDCIIPDDQKGTLAGHWPKLPIPIAFHSGDFGGDEVSAMTAAADTWNSFYAATQNIPQVLDYGGSNVHVSNQPMPADLCSQGLLTGGSFTSSVVIYRQNVWPPANGSANSVIALTHFCVSAASPLPRMYMAYMDINYQGFFRDGLEQPDMQTIVGHELGHLLGLHHSCEIDPATGQPNCREANLPSDYSDALMFPSFSFNSDLTGEQKRDLRDNDQGRANCLYGSVGGVQ